MIERRVKDFIVEKNLTSIQDVTDFIEKAKKTDDIKFSSEDLKNYFLLCDHVVNNQSELAYLFNNPTNINKGEKHNSTKLPLSVLFTQFPKALQAVCLASSYGHIKYKEYDQDYLNFKRVEGGSKAYFDADLRHSIETEVVDDESGLPHVFHEAFDKLAKCELWMEENNIDIKKMSKKMLNKWNNW